MRANEKFRTDAAFAEPRQRGELLERGHNLVLRIEWQRRFMRTVAVTRGVFGIFFHEVRGIGKQQRAEFLRCRIGEDRSAKAAAYQARQITGMIEVRVREYNKIYAGGLLR